MFGALNRFMSRLDGDPHAQQEAKTRGGFGFQCLRSSNEELPVEPWFDFIIGINGRQIDNPDPSLFATEVKNCAGSSVSLGIWSAKGQRVRSIYAAIPQETATLGLSLQWAPLSSAEDVWHILDVAPNSPADLAGLLPYGDYIIGSPEGLVKGEGGFGELVDHYIEKSLRLHVYNHEYNVTRLVTLQPSRNWGGTGALGCVLGYGALHRIPAPLDEPPQGPGETLFETARLSTDNNNADQVTATATPNSASPQYLVPADMEFKSAPPSSGDSSKPTGPPQSGTKKSRANNAPKGLDMDAYFAEGEAKSREQDRGSSPKPSATLAPPPKSGGPPRAGSPLKSTSTEEGGKAEE